MLFGKKLKRLFCVILAIVLVLGIGLYILVDSMLDGINKLDEEEYSPEQLESMLGTDGAGDIGPVIDQAEDIIRGSNAVNILLVGQDRREGEGERMHSDAMILCTINTETKTLTMTSFMRDIWVYIPGYRNARLNVPYMHGGFKLLNETLDYNFGVSADYNVEIDFSGFMTAVDLIGGVDIELTSAEAKYLNDRGNWGVEENNNWKLKKGVNCLTGSQALAYSRIRQIGDDFGRTNRQRTVLTALINKAKTLSVTQIYDLVREIIPVLTTDMSKGEIFGMVVKLLPMLSELKIVSQRIPLDGEYSFANMNGASVITLTPENFEAAKEILKEAMKKN